MKVKHNVTVSESRLIFINKLSAILVSRVQQAHLLLHDFVTYLQAIRCYYASDFLISTYSHTPNIIIPPFTDGSGVINNNINNLIFLAYNVNILTAYHTAKKHNTAILTINHKLSILVTHVLTYCIVSGVSYTNNK